MKRMQIVPDGFKLLAGNEPFQFAADYDERIGEFPALSAARRH